MKAKESEMRRELRREEGVEDEEREREMKLWNLCQYRSEI